ncbi:ABC-type uncharacterized transport system substrate-binding protein [Bradyrhizobium sp. USDA 4501]
MDRPLTIRKLVYAAATVLVSAGAALADPIRVAIANFGEHPDLAATIIEVIQMPANHAA